MADGKDMYLVSNDFVHDPVGTAEGLAEIVGIRRDCVKAFKWNAVAGLGVILERQDGM